MSIGIYLIRNKVNQKTYVGQSLHIERRWIEHKNSIQRKDKNTILIQAIRKYGWENFQCSILEETTEELLDEREQYWIQYYNSLAPNGYNVQLGGKSGEMTCPEEIYIIQDLLINSNTPMSQIADEHNMSLRSIIRINQGDVWLDKNKNYPLRKRIRTHGDGLETCPLCGKPKGKDAFYCVACGHLIQRKTNRPSKEELIEKVVKLGFAAVGREYGVSDKAIVKWCKAYGLPTKKKDLIALYQELSK